ncbi:MAG: hypothetical protein WC456_02650 [Patescibacteria group bacterium]
MKNLINFFVNFIGGFNKIVKSFFGGKKKNIVGSDIDQVDPQLAPEKSAADPDIDPDQDKFNHALAQKIMAAIKNGADAADAEYLVDKEDARLFHSARDLRLKIRILNAFQDGKKSKDKLVFAASLPHGLGTSLKDEMLATFQELIDVYGNNTHELSVVKSAASDFRDLEAPILEFLFRHLYRKYSWKFVRQVVRVSTCPNPDFLIFRLRTEICLHLPLVIALVCLDGISSPIGDSKMPLIMDFEDRYDFSLEKDGGFTWEEIWPGIKAVFNNYFLGGVDFIIDCQAVNND